MNKLPSFALMRFLGWNLQDFISQINKSQDFATESSFEAIIIWDWKRMNQKVIFNFVKRNHEKESESIEISTKSLKELVL